MERRAIDIPSLIDEDFKKLLPPSMLYPGLRELFGHLSSLYLKQIASKMSSYTWFRFVEQESKSLILKRMATRILYRLLKRERHDHICAGNDNCFIYGKRAMGFSSRGVNYKSVNEDGFGIFERNKELLLVVCDGVGDCLVGEVASLVILNQFQATTMRSIAQIFSDSVEQLNQLNEDLIREVPEFISFPNEVSQAAVTAVSIRENQCEIGQVGDVILYHIRDKNLSLLDQNRNWIDLPSLRRLFADDHYLSQRHIISNAVGRNYDPFWSPVQLTLQKDDILVLASDGLETLHPNEVLEMVLAEKNDRVLLSKLYDRLIETNLKWNTPGAPAFTKPDNMTVVLYRHK